MTAVEIHTGRGPNRRQPRPIMGCRRAQSRGWISNVPNLCGRNQGLDPPNRFAQAMAPCRTLTFTEVRSVRHAGRTRGAERNCSVPTQSGQSERESRGGPEMRRIQSPTS